MRSNAGMGNRQRNVDLRLAQVSALINLAWLGLTFNTRRRLWKRNVSFIGVHAENLRHLGREGSANIFIGLVLVPDIFL
jgi:hypothetical protein